MLDALSTRLERVTDALARAASRIETRFRKQATTERGNVPQFAPGPPGRRGKPWADIPIKCELRGLDVVISAPDWVMQNPKAAEWREEWKAIAREELAAVIGGR